MAKKIRIQNKDGKVLEVYEKAFQVVYEGAGFYPAKEEKAPLNPAQNNADHDDKKDIAEMTAEELKKVKNEDLKAYLDELEIEYKSNATKDELISLIVGE